VTVIIASGAVESNVNSALAHLQSTTSSLCHKAGHGGV
jgi:hypothetical protein